MNKLIEEKGFWFYVLLPILIIPWILKFLSGRSQYRANQIINQARETSLKNNIRRREIKQSKKQKREELRKIQNYKTLLKGKKVSKNWHLEIEDEEKTEEEEL